ncbi:hypothetical protein K435DRAFT_652520 [Dendrothele bispora CBS 962.96]|uniref:7alpha-cephem-methoxylase P8 chain related protein n=1 Tax=Dendrothele bispora (strain CBS 962.96) TaxID=1314807 RepID=A0A4S8MJ88_DENBC|nr:hypothetical protein K435DRAFT_652520 [Dendrothele bispora CBS 962.96]
MPATVIQSPQTVETTLQYFLPPPDGSRPYSDVEPTPGGRPQKNWVYEKHVVQIENVRGKESSVSLDTTGFQFYLNEPTKHKSFKNDEEVQKEYYPESIELIKKLTGASRVVPFDHTIRRRDPKQDGMNPAKRQPVSGVHVDQSAQAARNRVLRHLPESESAELLKHRFQIINLWRPISHPAYDWPLALCDYRSLDVKKDLVPVALVYPDREGETLGVKYNPEHKWKYFKGMTPDELVLIKCYDSKEDGSVSVLTPHTAFEDPSTPKDALPRESIELRTLVFYDD